MAVLAAYYDYRVKTTKDETDRCVALSLATTFGTTQPTPVKKVAEHVKEELIQFTELMPYEQYCALLEKDNPTYAEKINNAARKQFNPVKHLTHSKTQLFGDQLLRFAPNHPGHNSENWHFNPNLKLHEYNVKKVFEREKLLLWAINNAIQTGDIATISALNFTNPDQPNAVTISQGYFSKILKSQIAGYLAYKTKLMSGDLKTQEEQEPLRKKAAEEAAAKKKVEEVEEQKRVAAERQKQEEIEAQRLQKEIERRAQELAKQITEEEKRTRQEAEAAFKAAEEKKKRADREALLHALSESQSSMNASAQAAPLARPPSPAMPAAQATHPTEIPKLEQNPEDLCACKSGRKYKNCCKKLISSGSPQQP